MLLSDNSCYWLYTFRNTNRTSDITDVIANTTGGLVGYLLFLPVGRPLLRFCREKKEPSEEG